MHKIVAISSGLQSIDDTFDLSQFKDYKKYPGSIWYEHFSRICTKKGYTVIGANQALELIESKKVKPSNVYVIQERESAPGLRLLNLGANGCVLTCLESPLYAPKFYANLRYYASLFYSSYLFDFCHAELKSFKPNTILFPRQQKEPDEYIFPNRARQGACIIATYRQKSFFDMLTSCQALKELLRLVVYSLRSKHVLKSFLFSNLNVRLSIIRKLSRHCEVYIYGKGWEAASVFKDVKNIHLMGPIADKAEALKRHRFNICLENVTLDGYVTEKPLDALEHGCMPIYDNKGIFHEQSQENVAVIKLEEIERQSDLLDFLERKYDLFLNSYNPYFFYKTTRNFSHVRLAENVCQELENCINTN